MTCQRKPSEKVAELEFNPLSVSEIEVLPLYSDLENTSAFRLFMF